MRSAKHMKDEKEYCGNLRLGGAEIESQASRDQPAPETYARKPTDADASRPAYDWPKQKPRNRKTATIPKKAPRLPSFLSFVRSSSLSVRSGWTQIPQEPASIQYGLSILKSGWFYASGSRNSAIHATRISKEEAARFVIVRIGLYSRDADEK